MHFECLWEAHLFDFLDFFLCWFFFDFSEDFFPLHKSINDTIVLMII